MWKKIAIGGGVVAAIVGIGTASLAVTGDDTSTPGSGSTSTAAPAHPQHPQHPQHPNGHRRGAALARNLTHGQVVTQNPKTKEFVTHDLIHGSVTAVSSTSITVKAADGVSFTYTVNSDTAVRMRTAGKPHSGSKGSISDVKVGDKVVVAGTGTSSPYTAKHIVDGVD
jgi:hypothetical protein